MSERYKLTEPVLGGYCYWDVVDTQNSNFKVASFWAGNPLAENWASMACFVLNLDDKQK
jgi:hypothetical protein